MYMDKNVKKLIVGLNWLVTRRELNMIDDKLFLRLLSKEFIHCGFLKFGNKEISSDQIFQVNELVDCASDYWEMLPSSVQAHLTFNDYYRMGFISAVLRIMQILGIDENRVKK